MIALALAAALFQQQPTDPTPQLIDELEQKMLRLADRLEKTEPDQAKALRRGLQLLRDRGASDRARSAIEEFLKGNPENSARHRESVVTSLRRLLDILEGREKKEPSPHMTPEELIIAVEEELTRMIADQIALNGDSRREEGKPMTRVQQAAFLELATRQKAIRARAEECGWLLGAKGFKVFEYGFGRAGTDMDDVAGRLRTGDLSKPTRDLQDDIVKRLRDLLASVRQKRKENANGSDGGSGGGAEGNGEKPLLPDTAELELIRLMQEDVLRRTQSAGRDLKDVGEAQTALLRRLSDEQGELARLMRGVIEKMSK